MNSPELTAAALDVPAEPSLGLSCVVIVTERFDDVATVYKEYSAAAREISTSHEFVFVLDGNYPSAEQALTALVRQGEPVRVIKLAKWFGEATGLTVARDFCKGQVILTLPAYFQADTKDLPKVVEALKNHDVAVARRWPRSDSFLNRMQSWLFHTLVARIGGRRYHDLGCSVRAMDRHVLNELTIYADQHRFLPIIAEQQGFTVTEVNVAQARSDLRTRLYAPGVYVRRLLDLVSVFFLTKFTKKPLRFFGLIGATALGIGSVLLVWLTIDRFFLDIPLANRPLLLLASLLWVLGIQLLGLGLVGEIIIFTRARELKDYRIERVIN